MLRARKANAAADEVQATLSWGQREVTVDAGGYPRRLDIADLNKQRAVEVKTGYQTLTQSNRWQIARDRILVRQDWKIQWYFRGRPSRTLLDALAEAKIQIFIEP